MGGAKRQWQPFKLERQTETERERETDTQTHRQTDRNRERGRESPLPWIVEIVNFRKFGTNTLVRAQLSYASPWSGVFTPMV